MEQQSKKIYRLVTGEFCLATTDVEFVEWMRENETVKHGHPVTYNNKEFMHHLSLQSAIWPEGGFVNDLDEKRFVKSLLSARVLTVSNDYQ